MISNGFAVIQLRTILGAAIVILHQTVARFAL